MINDIVKKILLTLAKDAWWLLGLPFVAFAACVSDVVKGGRR